MRACVAFYSSLQYCTQPKPFGKQKYLGECPTEDEWHRSLWDFDLKMYGGFREHWKKMYMNV